MPFNIASYALLMHMLAQQCDMDVGDFVWTGGDCHLYSNHLYLVLHIKRRPDSVFGYEYEDFKVLVHDSGGLFIRRQRASGLAYGV